MLCSKHNTETVLSTAPDSRLRHDSRDQPSGLSRAATAPATIRPLPDVPFKLNVEPAERMAISEEKRQKLKAKQSAARALLADVAKSGLT